MYTRVKSPELFVGLITIACLPLPLLLSNTELKKPWKFSALIYFDIHHIFFRVTLKTEICKTRKHYLPINEFQSWHLTFFPVYL